MMEIKYLNNREDYIKGYEKGRKLALRIDIFKLTLTMAVLIGVFFYFIDELSNFYNVESSTYISIGFISVIIVTVTSIFMNIMSKKNIQKLIDKTIEIKSDSIDHKIIEIKDNVIIHKGTKSYFEYNIKAIDNIYEQDGVLVICIQRISPLILLPLSSFENEEQKSRFINLIKEKSKYLR